MNSAGTVKRLDRLQLAVFMLALLLAAVLYAPSMHGPLLHDDLLHFGPNSTLAWTSWSDPAIAETRDRYPRRFLGMGSFGVQHMLFGDDIATGKRINLALHLLNACLLLLVAHRLLRFVPDMSGTRRGWAAVLIAGIWLLHPLHVSTVAYTVQRLTLLSSLLTLAGMLAWLTWLDRGRTLRSAGWALLAVGLAIPAYYCKETGALLPVLLALVLPLAGWRPRMPSGLPGKSALALFTLLAAAALWHWLPDAWARHVAGTYLIRDFDLGQRLLTEARVLVFYVSEILWPQQSRMSLYLDDFSISRTLWQPWTTLPAVLAVAMFTVAGGMLLWRRSIAGFGILFFLAGHLLESTVIGLEIAYEHRNYLPAAGLLFAIIPWLMRRPPALTATLAIVGTLLLASNLGQRAAHWSDSMQLHRSMVESRPLSARAHLGLGQQLLLQARTTATPDTALQMAGLYHLRKAAALNPSGFISLHVLVRTLAPGTPEYDATWNELEARARYSKGSRELFNALQDMTQCVIQQPGCPLPAGHVERVFRAALDNPALRSAGYRRHLTRLLGSLLVRATGKTEEGLALSRSVAARNCPECRVSYFRNLVLAGRWTEARAYYPRVTAEGRLPAQEIRSLERARRQLETLETSRLAPVPENERN